MTLKEKNIKKETSILTLATGTALFIDQITKFWALKHLSLHQSIEVCPFFNLFLTYNKGVSFSLFAGNGSLVPVFLSLMGVFICLFVLYWMIKEKDFYIKLGLAYILGGAIGNIIDRIRLGYVIDFLDIYYKNHHWPAFNGADSFICIGAFIIFIKIFFKKEKEEK